MRLWNGTDFTRVGSSRRAPWISRGTPYKALRLGHKFALAFGDDRRIRLIGGPDRCGLNASWPFKPRAGIPDRVSRSLGREAV